MRMRVTPPPFGVVYGDFMSSYITECREGTSPHPMSFVCEPTTSPHVRGHMHTPSVVTSGSYWDCLMLWRLLFPNTLPTPNACLSLIETISNLLKCLYPQIIQSPSFPFIVSIHHCLHTLNHVCPLVGDEDTMEKWNRHCRQLWCLLQPPLKLLTSGKCHCSVCSLLLCQLHFCW